MGIVCGSNCPFCNNCCAELVELRPAGGMDCICTQCGYEFTSDPYLDSLISQQKS